MQINTMETIETLGTVAFAISGTFAAMQRRLDPFGVLIIAFVTSIGGGTVRDLLVGDTPVAWMRDVNYCLLILLTSLAAIFFKTHIKKFKVTLFLFDSLGLGLFTMLGIQKGITFGLSPGICVALGTITGCFGGVIRDTLLNTIPVIFHKEIYATACILGGVLFFLLKYFKVTDGASTIIVIAFIFILRVIVVRFKLALPKFGY
ncbi:trimeric intracellular cation channel family protein [Pedobacter hiemivivus]|uniref:Trimeric intracellular cation channel family protein n=1 Tax=Pedobacter hiemivivus TaxID=2530454 RepID=A0A4U1GBN1_9SPHI|nr:trimeric intracellular cation channel family protein [Pedobacter hiemivivus]TCC87138.1 trimeric intracellular cation channel family protein [Pedobacter hiemivivus]TKC61208.1 trimeric intracellular cation channel family protein [Pedobacter hiemivivus]